MAELDWVRFYGRVVDTNLNYGNRVVLKAVNPRIGYISVKKKDVYINNAGDVFVKRTAYAKTLGQEEI